MDKIIPVQVPLSPSEINMYCQANARGDNDILFEFDLERCPLKPAHVLGYLSNLKIDFRVVHYNLDFFVEYLRTPFLVGRSNLARQHANLLTYRTLNTTDGEVEFDYAAVPAEIVIEQMSVIRSLPLFLIESSDTEGPIKNSIVGETQHETDIVLDGVGVNIAHLVEFDDLFLRLVTDTLLDFKQRYYTHYFDEYIYGGDKLIQFFVDNPNNLLSSAVQSIIATHR